MHKKINLSVYSGLVASLLITGCSTQDIQPAPLISPTAIDAQIQNIVTPEPVAPVAVAPKTIYRPAPPRMVKPIQRMVKPIQRMPKPIQRPILIKSSQGMMSKPIQRQY